MIKLLRDALNNTQNLGICRVCLCAKYNTSGAIHCGCGLRFVDGKKNEQYNSNRAAGKAKLYNP